MGREPPGARGTPGSERSWRDGRVQRTTRCTSRTKTVDQPLLAPHSPGVPGVPGGSPSPVGGRGGVAHPGYLRVEPLYIAAELVRHTRRALRDLLPVPSLT